MIRLAMCGTDEPWAHYCVNRLRGAAPASVADCDAVIAESWPAGLQTAEEALLAKRHVLLPAGACGSVQALDRLIGAAQRGGGKFAIANPERYVPSRRLVKEQLDSGKLGEVGLVRIHRWETSPGQYDDPSQLPLGWPLDLDLALWLAGRQPETVFATGKDDFFQFVQIHLGFAGGAMALIDYAPHLPEGVPYRSLSVIGSNGAASADELHNVQLHNQGYLVNATLTDELHPLTIVSLVQEFVTGLNSGGDFAASVDSWRQTLVLAEAVQQSRAMRQAVCMEGD
jgi:predicted dehydrogenase